MNNTKIHKILIANRGEIALRICKAIKELGLNSVAIYAENDRELPYVSSADEAWSLGKGSLKETYLNHQKIIDIAKKSKADSIHPGYGFLSENSTFASLCEANNIRFIGPTSEMIDLMGNKSNARDRAKSIGIPVLEGYTGTLDQIIEQEESMIFPVLIKPSEGGGGKGMQIVYSRSDLHQALQDAERESLNYFNSNQLYLERYLQEARHIEVQILADHHGNSIHLYERDCSLQRRYQKVIEEAPSISISDKTRNKLRESALQLVKNIHYKNAGTVEFLVDKNEDYFFIEMNTRIQVEHPVTELITGIDIVKEQINIANNLPLSYSQSEVKVTGHSIQARIYAEDPMKDFAPSAGTLTIESKQVSERTDHAYSSGNIVTSSYDPMIAKIISYGTSREDALVKLNKAIENYHVSGIKTNREFLITLLSKDALKRNTLHTKYIDEELSEIQDQILQERTLIAKDTLLSLYTILALSFQYEKEGPQNIWNEIGHWRQIPEIQIEENNTKYTIPYEHLTVDNSYRILIGNRWIKSTLKRQSGKHYILEIDNTLINCWASINRSEISLDIKHHTFKARRTDIPDQAYSVSSISKVGKQNTKHILAPLNGKIVQVNISKNESVRSGDTLLVIESMKMENKILSPYDAEIDVLNVDLGDMVESDKLLITLK